ncbi:MAG: phosphoribosylamine--glycine ligase [Armatimonadetes bacterium]|nr:phosphoribosylamine--glycine ligase [Armatimonadota bacterium]
MSSQLRILVIGSGAREHALVWKLAQSPRAEKVYCAPGNAGIAAQAECVPISVMDLEALAAFAQEHEIGLTVVGPEAPLAAGIVDVFQERGLNVFGPTRRAAVLESSKAWSKGFFARHDLPTGCFATFDVAADAIGYLDTQTFPVAVKADGLAAGKGVTIAQTREEAEAAITDSLVRGVFGESGQRVVIEEFLEGPEVSMMAISDGHHLCALPASQDHKRVFDDDQGPNTGGMGCYSPVPIFSDEMYQDTLEHILKRTISAMAKEERPFVGCLYAGLVLTSEGPKLLEYNCRFGDPESQVVLPRLDVDLVEVLESAVEGRLEDTVAPASAGAAACVVMASGGYPGQYDTGKLVHGLEAVEQSDHTVVFHAATKATDEGLVTSGGRVLGVTGLGQSLPEALERAYAGVEKIQFEGAHFRRDIGRRAAGR